MCKNLNRLFTYILIYYCFILTIGCDKKELSINKAPICSITSPKNGDELVKGEIKMISIEADDADGLITEITIYIDSIKVPTPLIIPYQYQWNTTAAIPGKHTISVTVKDDSNNETFLEIAIFIIEAEINILEEGVVEDYDGNIYKTVKIGNQWWMAQNLKTTHFSDGTEINLIENNQKWKNIGFSEKAFCYYNDSISYSNTYGALYNWTAAMNGAKSSELTPSNVPGVCPTGWHLPSDAEWIILEIELGMSSDEAWLVGWRGTNEGSKMKSKEGWHSNGNGTNSSGFSALPAGIRRGNGLFSDMGSTTHFWTATEYFNIPTYAFNRNLDYNQSGVGWFYASHYYGYPKEFGFSVRCLKD